MEILHSSISYLPARQVRKAVLPALWLKLPADTPGACTERADNRLGTPIALHLFWAQERNTHFRTVQFSLPPASPCSRGDHHWLTPGLHEKSCLFPPWSSCIALIHARALLLLVAVQPLLSFSSKYFSFFPLSRLLQTDITIFYLPLLPLYLLPNCLPALSPLPSTPTGWAFLVGGFYGVGRGFFIYFKITWLGYHFFLLSPRSWQSLKDRDSPSPHPVFIPQWNVFSTGLVYKHLGMLLRHSYKTQARGGTAGPARKAAAPAPTSGCHLCFQFHMLAIKPPPCHILLQGKFMCRLLLPQALWQKDFTSNSEIRAEKNPGVFIERKCTTWRISPNMSGIVSRTENTSELSKEYEGRVRERRKQKM